MPRRDGEMVDRNESQQDAHNPRSRLTAFGGMNHPHLTMNATGAPPTNRNVNMDMYMNRSMTGRAASMAPPHAGPASMMEHSLFSSVMGSPPAGSAMAFFQQQQQQQQLQLQLQQQRTAAALHHMNSTVRGGGGYGAPTSAEFSMLLNEMGLEQQRQWYLRMQNASAALHGSSLAGMGNPFDGPNNLNYLQAQAAAAARSTIGYNNTNLPFASPQHPSIHPALASGAGSSFFEMHAASPAGSMARPPPMQAASQESSIFPPNSDLNAASNVRTALAFASSDMTNNSTTNRLTANSTTKGSSKRNEVDNTAEGMGASMDRILVSNAMRDSSLRGVTSTATNESVVASDDGDHDKVSPLYHRLMGQRERKRKKNPSSDPSTASHATAMMHTAAINNDYSLPLVVPRSKQWRIKRGWGPHSLENAIIERKKKIKRDLGPLSLESSSTAKKPYSSVTEINKDGTVSIF